MERVPDCWKVCENEVYSKEILKIRENILDRLDQAAENIFRIKRLMFGGEIQKIQESFMATEFILVVCLEALTSSFSIQCEKCEYRKIE